MAEARTLERDDDRGDRPDDAAAWEALGLRERQKRKRRSLILEAARTLFNRDGYVETTIEDIAAMAEVSPATVHNYYGGKWQLLIELVDQCDAGIRDEIDRMTARVDASTDAKAILNEMLLRIATGSLDSLSHHVWRHAIANSITREHIEYGISFSKAHNDFIAAISRTIQRLIDDGRLPPSLDPAICASVLYKIHHLLFVEMIVEPAPSLRKYKSAQRAHVDMMLDGACAAWKPTKRR